MRYDELIEEVIKRASARASCTGYPFEDALVHFLVDVEEDVRLSRVDQSEVMTAEAIEDKDKSRPDWYL